MIQLPRGLTLFYLSKKVFISTTKKKQKKIVIKDEQGQINVCLYKCICDMSILLMIQMMRYSKSYHLLCLFLGQ
jgi:hypothetical protein